MRFATCTLCRASKPVSAFSPDPRNRAGHHPRCKECRAASERSRAKARAKTAGAPVVALVRDLPAVEVAPPPADPPDPTPGRGPYLTELEKTLATAQLGDADAALVSIARGLARSLDGAYGDSRELALLTPRYLATLKALRLTRENRVEATPQEKLSLAAY